MSAKKVMIGIPVYAQMHSQFAVSLLHSLGKNLRPHKVIVRDLIGESLIPRGRNTLVSEFMNTDCTHLLFLDSDLVFDGSKIKKLLDHDEDIVCGVYPAKQLKTRYIVNKLYYTREDGLWSVREAGTGAMLIKREVFETMNSAQDEEGKRGWFRLDADTEKFGYDYFRTGTYPMRDEEGNILYEEDGEPKRRYLSEDWYFCQRWRQLGGEVFLDPECTFKHVGQMTYPVGMEALQDAVEHLEGLAAEHGVNPEDL